MDRRMGMGLIFGALIAAAPVLAGPASEKKEPAKAPSVFNNATFGLKMNAPDFAPVADGKQGRILQFNSPPINRVINTAACRACAMTKMQDSPQTTAWHR